MFGIETPRRAGRIRRATAVTATLLLGLLAARAPAVEPPPSRKMTRQIEVMERIIDQVLVDSPNFLIRTQPVARGAYIPAFGVLFTFGASLVEKDWGRIRDWSLGEFRIEEKNGRRIIILDPDEDWEEDEASDEESEGEDGEGRSWRQRHDSRIEKVYSRGKTEMVDVLLDYGDTLTTLERGQWVAIMAYLRGSDFFAENEFSRLILKAKIDDLRKYAAGDISEEEMIKRIIEKEY